MSMMTRPRPRTSWSDLAGDYARDRQYRRRDSSRRRRDSYEGFDRSWEGDYGDYGRPEYVEIDGRLYQQPRRRRTRRCLSSASSARSDASSTLSFASSSRQLRRTMGSCPHLASGPVHDLVYVPGADFSRSCAWLQPRAAGMESVGSAGGGFHWGNRPWDFGVSRRSTKDMWFETGQQSHGMNLRAISRSSPTRTVRVN
eukprot:TRINITY_DN67220_c0_g1_i1.p1 TRINITY_DN67220_c0_g1~~TRINITY_DN67220_c0_g1_i1.p1  ORF type:complete len:199 (-),score=10.08 TRINITY_DN67220_c0_g1_i1:181-777(-)